MTTINMKRAVWGAAAALAVGYVPSALAADLGGNCCADLEERIAELETTTARKGNRKVSLTISGQVHQGVLFFDDGVEQQAYIVDQDNTSSRFRFLGSAKIDPSWSAGFLLEIESESTGPASNQVTQLADDGPAGGPTIALRHSAWWIEHKDLGRVWVGQTSPATDDIILADAAGAGPAAFSDQLVGNSILFRNSAGALTNISTNTIAGNLDTARRNLVRYDTPTLAGFRATATYGEDDFWDVGLWYAGKLADFKVVGGIGYFEDTDFKVAAGDIVGKVTEFKGSLSILHEPSGLFGSGAFVDRDSQFAGNDARNRGFQYYYFNAGLVVPKLVSVGKTVFYGEYGHGDGVSNNNGAIAGTVNPGAVTAGEFDTYGFGVVQHVTAAELEIYAFYKNLDVDVRTARGRVATQDIDIVLTGARIKF